MAVFCASSSQFQRTHEVSNLADVSYTRRNKGSAMNVDIGPCCR
jgi:hypothetical protein